MASPPTAAAALAAVLLLIVAAGWLARLARRARPPSTARMRVEAALQLDSRRRLVLVQCDGRSLLLLTGTTDQIVGWLPDGRA